MPPRKRGRNTRDEVMAFFLTKRDLCNRGMGTYWTYNVW